MNIWLIQEIFFYSLNGLKTGLELGYQGLELIEVI